MLRTTRTRPKADGRGTAAARRARRSHTSQAAIGNDEEAVRVVAVDRPVVNQLDDDIVVEDGEAGGDERRAMTDRACARHDLLFRSTAVAL